MAKRGTSPFTHEDDAKTPIHPADSRHFDALHYGDEVPPKHQMESVILGPGAFGSPDPRTLGHRMNPLEDRPASAPSLDPNFEEFQGRKAPEQASGLGDTHIVVSEDELNQMSKSDVFDLATSAGLSPASKASKADLIDLILGEENLDEDEQGTNPDDDEDDD